MSLRSEKNIIRREFGWTYNIGRVGVARCESEKLLKNVYLAGSGGGVNVFPF